MSERASGNASYRFVMEKGDETYEFQFTDQTFPEVLRTLGRFASDPELSMTWVEARLLSEEFLRARDERHAEPRQKSKTLKEYLESRRSPKLDSFEKE